MKNLVMIIPVGAQQDLADCLRGIEHVRGFTFSHVEGHSIRIEKDPEWSVRDRVVGYTPKVRVDILLADEHVETVLSYVRVMKQRQPGVYWVQPVDSFGQIWNSTE